MAYQCRISIPGGQGMNIFSHSYTFSILLNSIPFLILALPCSGVAIRAFLGERVAHLEAQIEEENEETLKKMRENLKENEETLRKCLFLAHAPGVESVATPLALQLGDLAIHTYVPNSFCFVIISSIL